MCKYPQSCQAVFHLLEGGQHGLTVSRHRIVVVRPELLDRGFAQAGVKNGFGQPGADGPGSAGPIQQAPNRGALKCARSAQGHIRIVCGLGDADAHVRLGHAPLSRGNVRAPFEKFGGNTHRGRWRAGAKRLNGDRKSAGRFANQEGNRVLQLRAQDAEIRGLRLGGLKLDLGLRDVLVRSDAGLKAHPGQVQGLAVGADCIVKELFQCILRPQLEKIHGEFRLRAQACVLNIGSSGLGFKGVAFDGIANPAPEIGLP